LALSLSANKQEHRSVALRRELGLGGDLPNNTGFRPSPARERLDNVFRRASGGAGSRAGEPEILLTI
jgi:hypothetical protein